MARGAEGQPGARIAFNASRCLSCRACELACALAHSSAKDINEAIWHLPRPQPHLALTRKNGKPHILRCTHCKKPKCVDACEAGAIYRKEGLVLIDAEKCEGCWQCIEKCPFGVIAKNELLGVAQKCDFCLPGRQPACVASCPTAALSLK